MEAKDLLDLNKVAKIDKEAERLRLAKLAEKEARLKKKEVERAEKTGGLSNLDRLNQIGHKFVSLDFGETEYEE